MSQLESNLAKLPELCYGAHPTPGEAEVILMKRGESGYWPAKDGYVATLIDFYNARLDVTPAQRRAMEIGSLFGFHVPGADPDAHTAGKGLTPQAEGEDLDAYLDRVKATTLAAYQAKVKQAS